MSSLWFLARAVCGDDAVADSLEDVVRLRLGGSAKTLLRPAVGKPGDGLYRADV